MRLIYIAGPYTADTQGGVQLNIQRAHSTGYNVTVYTHQYGCLAIVPHYPVDYTEIGDQEFWLGATLELMRRCDAVYMMPGWQASNGAAGEQHEAQRLGMPVFEDLGALVGWAKEKESDDE